MKKLTAISIVAAMVLGLIAPVQGAVLTSCQSVVFDSLAHGAFSYDASGDNVVVAGTAFYDAIRADGYLGTQLVGNDGNNVEVAGNFAMYGVFHYVASDDVISWLASNINNLLAFEVRAWGVNVDLNGDNISDLTENFTLDAKGMPGFLTATLPELAAWGYTELAPGIWADIAVGPNNNNYAALSIVIDGFTTDNWGDVDATLLAGDLQGYTAGQTPGSGVRMAALPEPTAVLVWSALGVLAVAAGCWRRRKAA